MADDTTDTADDTTIDIGYEAPPVLPTTSTTAETEQGGTRAAPAPPAPRPPVPRPSPVTPPPRPPAPVARPSFFTPWRIAVGVVLVGGAAYAAYEFAPRGRR